MCAGDIWHTCQINALSQPVSPKHNTSGEGCTLDLSVLIKVQLMC